jgi:hypothetical protein
MHVLAYNSRKKLFFALKYLTTYTHETFSQEHTNFEGYYLSRAEIYLFKVSEVIYAPSRTD